MKKIINGKKYDTETATKIAGWDNDYFQNDFQYEIRRLYRKKTGEYFEYGEGGARSSFSENIGDGWCGGSRITPLTEAQAKEWCEKYANDEYESIFGSVEE